ncbi:hypothetical protein DL96DRAFT_1554443 [Flagelloscypha sp. PMI_526]|nr:hypothetical protein DL96DRAFT_1554443 [Flagelloscypha sp. PMI_526]
MILAFLKELCTRSTSLLSVTWLVHHRATIYISKTTPIPQNQFPVLDRDRTEVLKSTELDILEFIDAFGQKEPLSLVAEQGMFLVVGKHDCSFNHSREALTAKSVCTLNIAHASPAAFRSYVRDKEKHEKLLKEGRGVAMGLAFMLFAKPELVNGNYKNAVFRSGL